MIIEEVGLLEINSNSATYKLFNESTDTIVDKHQQCLSTFNPKYSEEQAHLPKMYSIQKLHKNPHKFAFFADLIFCSTKQLSVLLAKRFE